jgi:hypothetical protein
MALPLEAAAMALMLAFLGLGMAAVYALGRALAGCAVGTAAAALFATAPFVVYSSLRLTGPDVSARVRMRSAPSIVRSRSRPSGCASPGYRCRTRW